MDVRKYVMFTTFLMLAVSNLIVANGVLSPLEETLCSLYRSLLTLMPIVVLLMIILAGIVYAGGQLLGAETRARANVWATAMLTGALIGLLIVVLAPSILQSLAPELDWTRCVP